MLLVIDNYDSFTYNLVQYFGELKADLDVVRNDKISLAQIRRMKPERIVVSPDEKYLISNSDDYSISVWELGLAPQ